jgi:hypothetical protein
VLKAPNLSHVSTHFVPWIELPCAYVDTHTINYSPYSSTKTYSPTPSLAAPHSLSKDQPYPLRIRTVGGNLAVVSHQATIPTRTRALQDELTQAGTVPAAKYTPRYTHNMRQSILRFILTSPRHSSDFLRTNLCTTIDSQVPSPLPQMTTRWPAPALRGVQYAGHFGANNIEQQIVGAEIKQLY